MSEQTTPTGEYRALTAYDKERIRQANSGLSAGSMARNDAPVWKVIEQVMAEREEQLQRNIDAALQQTAFSKVVAQMPFVRYQRAQALREAADDWDNPSDENRVDLTQLAQDEYRVGGPSMPAIWLRRRAEQTEGDCDDE